MLLVTHSYWVKLLDVLLSSIIQKRNVPVGVFQSGALMAGIGQISQTKITNANAGLWSSDFKPMLPLFNLYQRIKKNKFCFIQDYSKN